MTSEFFSAHDFLQSVRRYLTLAGFGTANQMTLKACRAGCAPELAQQGHSLGEILKAGQWNSRVFLRCVDEDAVDHAHLFETIIDFDSE